MRKHIGKQSLVHRIHLFVKRIIETVDKGHHKSVVAINVNFKGVLLMVISKAVMVWGCIMKHGCPS